MSPLSNAFLPKDELVRMEPFFPLRALVCAKCFLVQLDHIGSPEEIFSDYVYFSSCSTTWVAHAAQFAEHAIRDLGLNEHSKVVEVASNDGYLLTQFVSRGIAVLGVEPAANVASMAMEKGVPSVIEFFGAEVAARLAQEGQADLLIGNNVLAHVPDLHDFVEGLRIMLATHGVISMEFPHLLRLIDNCQFDTIYHEHFSYFSLLTVEQVFRRHELIIFDAEEIPTHGGSLRIWARHSGSSNGGPSGRMQTVLAGERKAGLDTLAPYRSFSQRVVKQKWDTLTALIDFKRKGLTIVGYGAPAKGNTFLNYCGIGRDLVDFTVDISPHKQGLFLPGSHLPVRPLEDLRRAQPDLVLILPWNLEEEIVQSLDFVRDWGGRFLVRRPELTMIK